MRTKHGFCTLHRVAYNRLLDPTCPQCSLGHVAGAEQLDFGQADPNSEVRHPLKGGKPLDPFTLEAPE